MNTWAIISLIGLLVIIIIANWKNINVGLVGFAMAMLISTISGLKLKDVYSAFNTQIFLRMLSMQMMIVIARTNGTLEIIGNFALRLTKGNIIRFLPIIVYFVIGISSWLALGINSILTPLMFVLAAQMGFEDPLTLGFCTLFSLFSWGCSPYSMQGLNLVAYAAEQGYTLNVWTISFIAAGVGTVMFFALYFYYGWYKMKPIEITGVEVKNTKMGFTQICTLLGFASFVIANVGFGIDLMVVPAVAAVVLMCLGCGNPREVIKGIPWPTLFMIGGMTVYVGVIKSLGGVELLTSIISSVANKTVAPGLMALLCAFMSLFASGNGVVIPTMTSTISSLCEAIPGLNAQAMFVAVLMGANATCISPMSTVGAQSLAYYAAAANPTEEQTKKVFNRLFVYAAIFMIWAAVAGLLGIYAIGSAA